LLHLDATATAAPLGWPALIDALRRAFAEGCEVPLRHTHRVDDPAGHGGTVLLMPAWRPGPLPRHQDRHHLFPATPIAPCRVCTRCTRLFDARTGVPLAQLDGNEITCAAHRCGLGAGGELPRAWRCLAPARARQRARRAASGAEAMRALRRDASEVQVWNHRP
jgi:hypothetical protein